MEADHRKRTPKRIPVRDGKGACVAWTFTTDPKRKSVREGSPQHLKLARAYGQAVKEQA